jgi:hypothetical protein
MIVLFLVLGMGTGGFLHAPLSDLVFQSSLEEEAVAFARVWTEKDGSGLRERISPAGIRLHLPHEEHLLIRPRQAQAALEEFLNRYAAGEALISRVSLAGRDGRTGFAEIRWHTMTPGLSEAVIFTVFLGYTLTEDRWTVTEIRVLSQ